MINTVNLLKAQLNNHRNDEKTEADAEVTEPKPPIKLKKIQRKKTTHPCTVGKIAHAAIPAQEENSYIELPTRRHLPIHDE